MPDNLRFERAGNSDLPLASGYETVAADAAALLFCFARGRSLLLPAAQAPRYSFKGHRSKFSRLNSWIDGVPGR